MVQWRTSPFFAYLGCLLGRKLFLLRDTIRSVVYDLAAPTLHGGGETGPRSKNVARDMEKEEDVFCVLGRSYRAGSPLRRHPAWPPTTSSNRVPGISRMDVTRE